MRLGASVDDLVPFEKYVQAAASLGRPSSAARALANGAHHIERVDSLVVRIARQLCLPESHLCAIEAQVDERLRQNRSGLVRAFA
jgi:hypothetical protein